MPHRMGQLVCVNDSSSDHATGRVDNTTMRSRGEYAIQGVVWRREGPSEAFEFNRMSAEVVRLFRCEVCGYVELYSSAVVPP